MNFLQAILWEPLPSFVFGLFAMSSGLLYVFLPETLGQTLSDTIEETEQKERIANKKLRWLNLVHSLLTVCRFDVAVVPVSNLRK